jgi:hypothetical protein
MGTHSNIMCAPMPPNINLTSQTSIHNSPSVIRKKKKEKTKRNPPPKKKHLKWKPFMP